MSSVSVRGLGIRYGRQPVLDALDLEVEAGEFVVLLGPSGCGKSTLLHGIAGLVPLHAGSIRIGDRDMTAADPSERGIGMVFQSYALYPTLTVERNLSFGLRAAGRPRREVQQRVQDIARMLQLEPLLARKPAQLSGGQRQRVAIGRALARDARVFLLDEPFSNLDAQLRAELRRELKLLHRRLGATMIHVTHDQVEATTLASRIVVMRGGRIQQVGTPAEVYERPCNRFVAGFVGAPTMNFVEGFLQTTWSATSFLHPNGATDLSRYAFTDRVRDGAAVTLGIRPEHLALHRGNDGPAGAWAGTVHLIEPLGNQQLVWVDCGGLLLAALVPEALPLRVDDAVRLFPDLDRVSVFGAASQVRL